MLYRILTVTHYRIYVNYRILTVRKTTSNFPVILREKLYVPVLYSFLFINSNEQQLMTLAGLIPSETVTIVPEWHWCNCSQVTLSDTDCCQVTLARLLPSDTGTIVPKWHWHDCSQVTLAQLFPSDTGMIVPKWHWRDCF